MLCSIGTVESLGTHCTSVVDHWTEGRITVIALGAGFTRRLYWLILMMKNSWDYVIQKTQWKPQQNVNSIKSIKCCISYTLGRKYWYMNLQHNNLLTNINAGPQLCTTCGWLLLMFKGNTCKILAVSCKPSPYLVRSRWTGFWGRLSSHTEVPRLTAEVCGGGGDLTGGAVVPGVTGTSHIGQTLTSTVHTWQVKYN